MIVNHEHKFVFLHIPKTGGTSIATALSSRDRAQKVGRTKHHVVPELMPEGYFVFTFVRNPWDRMLSYYLFRHSEPRTGHRKTIHPDERRIGFSDWLKRLDEFSAWENINPAFHIAVSPQRNTVGDLPDFTGRFESMQADLEKVCTRLGIDGVELTNVNKTSTKKKHYASYFDDESVELIEKRFKPDIDHYGYNFERQL